MSLLSKILLGFVIFAACGFLWASSRALKTWSAYRDVYNRYAVAVDRVEAEVLALREGSETEPSIRDLKTEQTMVYFDRGRVWTGCQPRSVDLQTGIVQIRTGFPDPPELPVGTIVHVFETSDDPALGNRGYLGEFSVTASAPPDPNGQAANVTLEWLHKYTIADVKAQIQRIQGADVTSLTAAADAANLPQLADGINTLRDGIANSPQLDEGQKLAAQFEIGQLAFMVRSMQRLANSSGPWALYQVMPGDSYERFAEIPQDELLNRFPAANVQMMSPEMAQLRTTIRSLALNEYLKHGAAPDAEAPLEEVQVRVRFKKNFGDPGVDQQALAQMQIRDFTNEADPGRRVDVTRLVTEGQEAWISAEVVETLKGMGLVDEMERRYQRPRRDYTQIFNDFYRASPVLDDKIRAMLADRVQAQNAATLAEAHNVKLQQHVQKLTAERNLLTEEAQFVSDHVADLEEQHAELQEQIDQLEKQNQEWAALLAEEQFRLQNRIESAASAQASSQ